MTRLTTSMISFAVLLLFTCMLWSPGNAGVLYSINDSASSPEENPLISIDTTTLVTTNIGDLGVLFTSGGLAYDPNSDILYMIDGRSVTGADRLYIVDRLTGAATPIGIHGVTDLLGLAFDSTNNILYASSYDPNTGNGAFYTLNTGTGAAGLVGDTRGYSGLAYDPNTDRLLGMDGTAFHVIDRTTGGSNEALADFGIGALNGLAYDSDLNRWWQSTSAGDLFSYDAHLGTQTQHIVGGSGAPRLDSLTYVSLVAGDIEIDIDIKPGSDPNSINLCSMGVIPVAILGSATFDVNDINTSTLALGDAVVKIAGRSGKDLCHVTDVNDDGFDDLVCQFVTIELGFSGGDTTAMVVGELNDATPFEGTDDVNIVKDTCG